MTNPTIGQIREEYSELASIPTPASGKIFTDVAQPELFRIETRWSQKDITRGETYPFGRSYFIKINEKHEIVSPDTIISCPASTDECEHLWDVWSPSESLRAVILKHKSKDGKKDEQYILQIWNTQQLLKSINLSEKEKHGKVYDNDNLFGCCSWSHDEGHLVYVAEEKEPKKHSYFSSKAKADEEGADDEEKKPSNDFEIGTEYDFKDDWGEQMTGKIRSVLCVMDLETETVLTIDNVPENVCCGQAVWCPKDTGFVFVGLECNPFRLGSIYCEQRPASIYHVDLESGSCEKLSKPGYTPCSPRFSPNGHTLIWLENKTQGAHRQCKRLVKVNWHHSKEPVVVIDFVHKAGEGAFPGIFCTGLPRRCWSSDSKRVIFHSEWRSKTEIMVVQTQTKLGCRLPENMAIGSSYVVDVYNDLVLAVQSSPSRPHHFVIAQLPPIGSEESVEWVRLPDQPGVVEGVKWRILTHEPDETNEHPDFGRATYESILLSPDISDASSALSFAKLGSLVVMPHGGPHGCFAAEFFLTPVALVHLGFSVLLINFRGSTGFGQDSIDTLPGRIGTLDVLDCQKAVEEVLASSEEYNVDRNRVCLYGGSHGGFLTVHLIGQYPDFYKAASCRNPVINLTTMLGTTDITDWVFVESGIEYFPGSMPSTEVLASMWEKSPLRYVDSIKTPLLIALGAKDRRVPPKQGSELYRALLARGRTVKMSVYPEECHPISSVPSASDAFVNMVRWFLTYLPNSE